MVWPPFPKYIFSQKTTSYWFIKNRHIYIYNNQPSNLSPNPMERIVCFSSFGLWSDGKNGNIVKSCMLYHGKATCWTHFPVRHGCWYQRQLLGYILTICTSLPFLRRDTTIMNYSLGMRPMKIEPMTVLLCSCFPRCRAQKSE